MSRASICVEAGDGAIRRADYILNTNLKAEGAKNGHWFDQHADPDELISSYITSLVAPLSHLRRFKALRFTYNFAQ